LLFLVPATPSPESPLQILSLPASSGAAWLRDGWRLLKRQPIGLSAMVVVYVFVLLLPVLVPVPYLGLVLLGVVSPFATLGLMAAFREVAAGRLPTPTVFAQALQDTATRAALFRLGLIHAGLMVIVVVIGGFFVGPLPTGPDADRADMESLRPEHMAAVMLLYAPVMIAMWFSPMLAGWHRLPVGKAMFGSAVAFWRNKGALSVYAVLALGVMIIVSAVATALIGAFFSSQAAPIVAAPIALALTTYIQASFYPMYRSIFTEPPAAA
jgi:hypothetical protein